MAINLVKNKETLQQAWKDVLECEKSGINWALFGYDGQTFDLKLVGKGDGGLEEMIEEFNSGKIMYAFCRVMDPKTSLPKFVLINWQGEGAPSDKKGRCANHIRDVNNFFKGAHLTINARTDDDVEPDIVVAQVVKATGSAYSFGERAGPLQHHKPIVREVFPVSSVYKRTIPTAEINPSERDRFWEKEEADERRRLADDQRKAAEAKKKLDDERRQRELQDAQRREEVVNERSKSISQLRASEKVKGVGGEVERQKWQRQMEDDAREEADRKRRSDSSREERTQEVQALISKRTINARAIFEQNTSAGQLSTIKHRPPALRNVCESSTNGAASKNGTDSLGNSSASISSPASIHSPPSTTSSINSPPSRHSTLSPDDRTPPSPAPDSSPYSYRIPNGNAAKAEVCSSSLSSDAKHQSNSTNSLLKENLPPGQRLDSEDDHQDDEDQQQDWEAAPVQDYSVTSSEQRPPVSLSTKSNGKPSKDDVQINEVSSGAGQTTAHRAQLAFVDDNNCDAPLQDGQEYVHEAQGLTARALYDYEAADETEISFNPDDIITNIDQIDEGWWQGLAPDGTYGLFPANYVELVE